MTHHISLLKHLSSYTTYGQVCSRYQVIHLYCSSNVICFNLSQEPKFETVTRETVETYRGNRPERVTTSEKRDVFQNLPDEFRTILQREENGNT